MEWASKCDRCGKYFDWRSDESSAFAFMSYEPTKARYSIDSDKYDLCPKCVQDLYDWFDRKENSQ